MGSYKKRAKYGVVLTYQNTDGGFGGAQDYSSNIPDTAQALHALAIAASTETTAINGAVSYLLSKQNTDGGWGFIPGKPSEIYYTAVVMQELERGQVFC
jgi:prenyltransferase beta subunit